MARSFCIPGIILLFIAFVLMLFATISLPYVHEFDIVRANFPNPNLTPPTGGPPADQVRFGIWAFCIEDAVSEAVSCGPADHGYSFNFLVNTGSGSPTTESLGASYTKGLIITPIATAIIFVAFLLSFSEHLTVTLISSLLSFLSALITLIAFAVDIAVLARLRHILDGVPNSSVDTAPAFWFTFVAFILLLLAGCTVCCGRRTELRRNNVNTTPSTRRGLFSRRTPKA